MQNIIQEEQVELEDKKYLAVEYYSGKNDYKSNKKIWMGI